MSRKHKRSRKSFEGFRRRYLGDLRYMLSCCRSGRLPRENAEYLEDILLDPVRDPLNLPKPREVAERVRLTNEQRERTKLWTIPPIDMTPKQLAEQRREKDRRLKARARRRANMQSREAYLAQFPKPWIAAGVSRSAWYRRQSGTGLSGQPKPSGTGLSARIYYKHGHTCPTEQSAPPFGQQDNVLAGGSSEPPNVETGLKINRKSNSSLNNYPSSHLSHHPASPPIGQQEDGDLGRRNPNNGHLKAAEKAAGKKDAVSRKRFPRRQRDLTAATGGRGEDDDRGS